jgi:gliding motility-associated lipoprotein GldH
MAHPGANGWLLLLLLLLTACDDTVYHGYNAVDGDVWKPKDTLVYRYVPNRSRDVSGMYVLRAGVRVTAGYEYRNLVLRVESYVPGAAMSPGVDTVVCKVYDNEGRREGSTAGLLYQLSSNAVQTVSLLGDTVVFRISHLMDDDSLRGVSDVGLKLMSVRE